MTNFQFEMLKKTHDMGCDKANAIHYCFVCGKPFGISDAVYCEACNWWKSPCGHCGCTLTPEERMNLETAYLQICGQCKINPKKKKRGSSNIIRGVSKEYFLEWTKKMYPDLYSRYTSGELSFEDLHREVSLKSGLVWIF